MSDNGDQLAEVVREHSDEEGDSVLDPGWLRGELERLGLTASELATRLGLPNPRTIHNWLSGRREIPLLLRPALWALDHGWTAGSASVLDFADKCLRSDGLQQRRLFSQSLDLVREVWLKRYDEMRLDRGVDYEVEVRHLMEELGPIGFAGHGLVEHGEVEATGELLLSLLAEIYSWTEVAQKRGTYLAATAGLPRVFTYNLFFLWAVAAVRFKNWKLLRKLFCAWLPASIEQRGGGPLWSNDLVFHPEAWGRSATKTFDFAFKLFATDSYLAPSYSGELFVNSAVCMDFLLVLFSVANEKPERREFVRYPNFRRHYVHRLEPFVERLARDMEFCGHVSEVVGEDCTAFRKAYEYRAETINRIPMHDYRTFFLETHALRQSNEGRVM